MYIKEKISQYRRDFWAHYACEYCDFVSEKESGYDDTNFHNNVIPNMECPDCGKKAEGPTSRPDVPAHVEI